MKKIVITSAVALATTGVAIGVIALAGNAGAVQSRAVAFEAGPVGAVAQVAPLDLGSETLTYAKKGAAVRASKNGAVVATITLESAEYTDSSGHAVFTVDATRPILLDPQWFILYDDQGENSPTATEPVTLAAGRHSVVLDFRDTATPEAIGWAPSDGEAVWAR